MRFVFVAAVACFFLGAAISWTLATIAVLRIIHIELPWSLPFYLFRQKTPAILNGLQERTINTYVAVSGLLLFACPLFAGLLTYDYVVQRYIQHSGFGLKYAVGSLAWLLLLVIVGVRRSLGHWQKRVESGIGVALLTMLALKVTTDLAGAWTTASLIAAGVCCAFVYFGLRRIGGTLGGKEYSNRRDMPLQQNFVSEPFVPSESPTAEQVARVHKLMVSGVGSPSREPREKQQE